MIDYKKYYNYFEKIDRFIEKSIRIEHQYKLPGLACALNFFRSLKNLIFGDHHWYSYNKGRHFVKIYLDNKKIGKKKPEISKKVKALYRKLEKQKGEKFVEKLSLQFAKRFKTTTSVVDKTCVMPVAKKEKINLPKPPKLTLSRQDEMAKLGVVPKKALPEISAKLLFHLQSDEAGEHSKYEGLSSNEILQYLISYMQQRSVHGGKICDCQDELIYQLQNASTLYETFCDPKALAHHIKKAFTESKPCLIPGGWGGALGSAHAMYYELIPSSDKKSATLRIFNTGDGISSHEHFLVGVKEKVRPVEWKNISYDNLLKKETLQVFSELLKAHLHEKASPIALSAQDIYHGLKKQLGVKPEDCLQEELIDKDTLMKPQRAGVCSYRSLMAYFKTKMTLNEFRRFECDIRIQGLTSFVGKSGQECEPQDLRLVSISLRQLARKINSLARQKAVSKNYLKQARQALATVNEFISARQAQSLKKNVPFEIPSFEPQKNRMPFWRNSDFPNNQLAAPLDSFPASHLLHAIKNFSFNNPSSLFVELTQALDLLNAAKNKNEADAVYFAAIEIVKKLPAKSHFWKKSASSWQKKEKILALVSSLSKLLFESAYLKNSSDAVFNETQVAAHKLLGLQWRLVKKTSTRSNNLINLRITNFGYQVREQFCLDSISKENSDCRDHLFKFVENRENDSESYLKLRLQCRIDSHELGKLEKFLTSKVSSRHEKALLLEQIKQASSQVTGKSYTQLKSDDERYLALYSSLSVPKWFKELRESYFRVLVCSCRKVSFPSGWQEIGSSEDKSPSNFDFKISLSSSNELKVDLPGEKFVFVKKFQSERSISPKMSWIYDFWQKRGEFSCFRNLKIFENEKKLIAKKRFESFERKGEVAETKELMHIFSSDQASLVEALEFFSKRPEKLNDPDYQIIFQIACFGLRSLLYQLSASKAQLVCNFLQKQLDLTKADQQETSKFVFLLRMNRYFCRFNKYAANKEKIDAVKEIKKRLLLDLCPEERAYLNQELSCCLLENKTLSEEQMKEVLIALVLSNKSSLKEQMQDKKAQEDIQKGLLVHSKAICDFLLKGGVNQEALNSIYKSAGGTQNLSDWKSIKIEGREPVFTMGDAAIFYPLKGRLDFDCENSVLPNAVLNNSLYKKLFPKGHKQAKLVNDRTYQIESDSGTCTFFKDDNGLRAFRKINGQMFEALYSHNICDHLESKQLLYGYMHWFRQPGQFVLIPKNSDQVEIEIKASSASTTIRRLSDRAILGKSSGVFSNFENSSYIHEWFVEDTQELVEVALPRFKLTFITDLEKPPRMHCVQYPGFWVSSSQKVDFLEPSKTQLILENRSGQKMALLPKLELIETKEKEVLLPKASYEHYLNENEIKEFDHYLFKIDEKGALFGNSIEANLYLALTLAASKNYFSAMKLLRDFGNRLSGFSEKEVQILEQILMLSTLTGDESGELVGIALYTATILESHSKSEKAKNKLPNLYEQYLFRYHNVTFGKLRKQEELRILKNLLSRKFNQQFFTRLQELDPSYAYYYPYSKQIDELKLSEKQIDFECLKNSLSFEEETNNAFRINDDVLLVRAAESIEKRLFDVVCIALKGKTEEKTSLLTASFFLQSHGQTTPECAIGYLLESMIMHPEKYKKPPPRPNLRDSKKENDAVDAWWKKTLKTAQEIVRIEALKPSAIKDMTPPFYRLDKKEKKLPDLLFRFNFKSNSLDDELYSFFKKPQSKPALSDEEYLKKDALLAAKQKHFNDLKETLKAQEWGRLREGLKTYRSQEVLSFEMEKSPQELRKVLSKNVEALKVRLIALESKLLELANAFPKDDDKRTLLLWGGVERTIVLADILVSFAKKDPSILQKLNSYLTQENLDEIYFLASEFLQQSCFANQIETALGTVKQLLSSEEDEKSDIINLLGEQLFARRAFDPKEHPEYLVFEHYSGLMIRNAQINMIDEFLNGEKNCRIKEMIMGSGKSKVLLPLLGLLRADKKNLSLLIVPSALFEDVSSETEKIMRENFSTSLKSLNFDRNTTFSYRSLEEIRDTLKEVIRNQECLIMTNKSVSSLILKFVEHSEMLYKQGKFEDDKTALMQEIIEILSERSNPIVDEADTILNVLHEVSFSLGKQRPPKPYERALIGELFNILYTDPEIKPLAAISSDPKKLHNSKALTKEIYHSDLKPVLAEKLVERLYRINLGDVKLTESLKKVMESLGKKEKKMLTYYLKRDEKKLENSKKFVSSLPEEVQKVLKLASDEICQLLPHTLTKTANVNYGLYKDVFAIPFKGATVPSKTSIYDSPYITMNYTYALYHENGIGEEYLEKLLEGLYKDALQETQETGKLLTETASYRQFTFLRGNIDIPLKGYSQNRLQELKDEINSSSDKKHWMIEKLIFPKVALYSKRISCSALNFASFFKKIEGFTGTLVGAMHSKINQEAEIVTDAKIFAVLYALKDAPVLKIRKGPVLSMLKQIKKCGVAFDLISDGGGYFKEGGNAFVADKIAEAFGKPTVFYSEQDQKMIVQKGQEHHFDALKLDADERLTFLDQVHTTGSDIPQKLSAKIFVTIGKEMTLRDFSQAAFRARKIGKGQTIGYLIDEEVEALIRQKLKLSEKDNIGFIEIYDFVLQNKCEKLSENNLKAFKKELLSYIQQLLIEALKRKDIKASTRLQVYTALRKYWACKKQTSLDVAVMRPKEEVLKEESERTAHVLKKTLKKFFFLSDQAEIFLKGIDEVVKTYENLLPPFILSQTGNEDDTSELCQEADVDISNQAQVETVIDQGEKETVLGAERLKQSASDYQIAYWTYYLKTPLRNLSDLMGKQTELKAVKDQFKGIKVVANFLEWEESCPEKKVVFGDNPTPIHALKVDGDKVAILTQVEERFSNFNIHLGFTKNARPLSKTAFQKIVKIKFLSGECTHYSSEEIKFLRLWLKKAGAEKMRKFFIKSILKTRPDLAAAFPSTLLACIFEEAIKRSSRLDS